MSTTDLETLLRLVGTRRTSEERDRGEAAAGLERERRAHHAHGAVVVAEGGVILPRVQQDRQLNDPGACVFPASRDTIQLRGSISPQQEPSKPRKS